MRTPRSGIIQEQFTRMRSGVPDQKGVLGMIRRLPEYHLSSGNNKGWHGTVALHFWFFLTEPDDPPLQQDNKQEFYQLGAIHHKGKKTLYKKKDRFTMAGTPVPGPGRSSL
jgi:hypothetical protein